MTISGNRMNFYNSNKNKVAKQNGFVFKQLNKQTKTYSHFLYKNISYFLKFQIPNCHRQFFRVISQDREDVENFCNDMENPFHFACQKPFYQLNYVIVCNFIISILFVF